MAQTTPPRDPAPHSEGFQSAGTTVRWTSPTALTSTKYGRLVVAGMHAHFTHSPFWPKDINEFMIHNAEFATDRAEEEREGLIRKIEIVERMKENSRTFLCREGLEEWRKNHGKVAVCMPGLVSCEPDILDSEEDAKDKSTADAIDLQSLKDEIENATDKEVMTLREKVEKAVASFMGKVTIEALNANANKGLSKVLGLKTKYWRGNEEALIEGECGNTTEEFRAYWPSGPELKAEGEERLRTKNDRRLPAPRLDMYSPFFVKHFISQIDRKDKAAVESLLKGLVKISGQNIEHHQRHIAPYEGPLDALESVKIRYEEEEAEKFVDAAQPLMHGFTDVQANPSGDWDWNGVHVHYSTGEFQGNGTGVVNYQTNGYGINGNSFQFYDYAQHGVGHGFGFGTMGYTQAYNNNNQWMTGMAYHSNQIYNTGTNYMQYAPGYSGSQGVDAEIAFELGVVTFNDHVVRQDNHVVRQDIASTSIHAPVEQSNAKVERPGQVEGPPSDGHVFDEEELRQQVGWDDLLDFL